MNPKIILSDQPFERDLRLQSFDSVMAELDQLRKAPQIRSSPGWNLPHTFDHCARSIEHAMLGFPVMKNPVFRAVVGKTAFHLFDLRGYMAHNLTEEIPGDPEPPADLSLDAALARLQDSIRAFESWTGPMQPHFTYGDLSKSQYERANAMHVANHLAVVEY